MERDNRTPRKMGNNKMNLENKLNPYAEDMEKTRIEIQEAIQKKDYTGLRQEITKLESLYANTREYYEKVLNGLYKKLEEIEIKEDKSISKEELEKSINNTREKEFELIVNLNEIDAMKKIYEILNSKKEDLLEKYQEETLAFILNPYDYQIRLLYGEYDKLKKGKGKEIEAGKKLKQINFLTLNLTMYLSGLKAELKKAIENEEKEHVVKRKLTQVAGAIEIPNEKGIQILYNKTKAYYTIVVHQFRNLNFTD
jgi:hypothetical protein